MKAKVERFGRYAALLPDIQLAIDGAAERKIWLEALRFCLLEGYVREAAKQKWQTGAILLDAVEGNLDHAVDEARAISDRDVRVCNYSLSLNGFYYNLTMALRKERNSYRKQ